MSGAADSFWQGEHVGLLWVLSPKGFTVLGVPAFMPFLACGASQLPKFPVSTKPLAQGSGMAGTPLEWGQAEPWQCAWEAVLFIWHPLCSHRKGFVKKEGNG